MKKVLRREIFKRLSFLATGIVLLADFIIFFMTKNYNNKLIFIANLICAILCFAFALLPKLNFEDLCYGSKKLSNKKLSSILFSEQKKNLNLKKYDLTERQAAIIKEFFTKNETYKELANTFITSESTIKHEMSIICRKFGVSNSAILRILLEQYDILE